MRVRLNKKMTIEEKIEDIILNHDFLNGNKEKVVNIMKNIFFNNENNIEFSDFLYNIVDDKKYCDLYNFKVRFYEFWKGYEGEMLKKAKSELLANFIYDYYNNHCSAKAAYLEIRQGMKGSCY